MRYIFLALLAFLTLSVHSQTDKQFAVFNGSLYYAEKGNGDVILFVHGLQEDYRTFMPQLNLLSDNYHVIAYSRRYNYPNHNSMQTEYSPKTEAEDLGLVIEQIGKPVHLVGHGYGGLIALHFALLNPNKVKTLTLTDPILVGWLQNIAGCSQWQSMIQQRLIEETGLAFESGDTAKIMNELFELYEGLGMKEQRLKERQDLLKANLKEIDALVSSNDGFLTPNMGEVTKLRVPMLTIFAEQTVPMIKCTNERLESLTPSATHQHVKEASHDMWIAYPEKMATLLLDFITKK